MPEFAARKPSVVPYVLSWSDERVVPEGALTVKWDVAGPKLGYKEERVTDRVGRDQVLWARMTN